MVGLDQPPCLRVDRGLDIAHAGIEQRIIVIDLSPGVMPGQGIVTPSADEAAVAGESAGCPLPGLSTPDTTATSCTSEARSSRRRVGTAMDRA